MVQIQINVSNELDKKIKIHAAENELSSKEKAVIKICEERLND